MMYFSGFLLVISTTLVFSISLQENQGLPPVLQPRSALQQDFDPKHHFLGGLFSLFSKKCTCGVRNVNGVSRIVGGTEAKNGEFPWRVFVLISNSTGTITHLCGGTIISQNWVMTAGHCVDRMTSDETITIYAGTQSNPLWNIESGTNHSVDYHVLHPNFNRSNLDNDISLLHIHSPIKYANNVGPVCLPWNLVNKNLSGASVVTSGWGTTEPVGVDEENMGSMVETLMEVSLPYLTTSECREYLETTDNQVCTYNPGQDACQGDSGGSIDYQGSNSRYYSVGVVSWGNGCAQEWYPGVYAKVTNYLQWIQSTTADTFCKV